jgi:hypothetical protein
LASLCHHRFDLLLAVDADAVQAVLCASGHLRWIT